MKRLFLASELSETAKLIPEIFKINPQEIKVAFIPTAKFGEEGQGVSTSRKSMADLGFQIIDIDLREKTKEDLERELSQVKMIVVGGGNTYYLLHYARKSGFVELIPQLLEKGIIYVGSSAGSILACPDIDYVRFYDDRRKVPELTSYEGMNLINASIYVHFGAEEYKEAFTLESQTIFETEQKVILLRNTQAVVVEDDRYQIVSIKD